MEDKKPLSDQPENSKAEADNSKAIFSLNELDELKGKLAKQQQQIKDALKMMNDLKEKSKAIEKKQIIKKQN